MKNKIELALLGYTVYADGENYFTMLKRLFNHFVFNPIKKILKVESCEYCGKLTRNFERVVVDYEPDEDGGHRVWGYVCENCYYYFQETN